MVTSVLERSKQKRGMSGAYLYWLGWLGWHSKKRGWIAWIGSLHFDLWGLLGLIGSQGSAAPPRASKGHFHDRRVGNRLQLGAVSICFRWQSSHLLGQKLLHDRLDGNGLIFWATSSCQLAGAQNQISKWDKFAIHKLGISSYFISISSYPSDFRVFGLQRLQRLRFVSIFDATTSWDKLWWTYSQLCLLLMIVTITCYGFIFLYCFWLVSLIYIYTHI